MESNVKNVNKDIIGVILVGIVLIMGVYIFTSLADIGGTTEYFSSSENSTMNTSSVFIAPVSDGVSSFSAQTYNQTWLNFDGNDYVNISGIGLTNPLLNTFNQTTYSIWFKSNNWTSGGFGSLSKEYIFGRENGSGSDERFYVVQSNISSEYLAIELNHLGATDIIYINKTGNYFNRNAWHHLVITINGSTAYIYLDGVMVNSDTITFIPTGSEGNIWLGRGRNTYYYNGSIDDFRALSNYTIMPSRVVAMYRDNVLGNGKVFIPVMMRHGIGQDGYQSEAIFRAELSWLNASGFQTITDVDYYNWRTFGNFTMPEKPIIYIFDDGLKSVNETIAPIMAEYGYKGVMALIPSRIGINASYYMNWSNVNYTIQYYNWSVASHSQTHCSMITAGTSYLYGALNCTDQVNQLSNMSQAIESIKGNTTITPITFIHPFNAWNSTTMNLCKLNYSLCFGSSYDYFNGRYITIDTNLTNGDLSRLSAEDYSDTTQFFRIFNYTLPILSYDTFLNLNEDSGTTAYDSSGNGNNGTISGATWQNDGVLLPLTENTDYSISNNGLLSLLNSNYLYSYIVKYWTYFTESTNPGTVASLVMVDSLGNSTTFLSILIVISFAVVILTLFKPSVNTNPLGKPHY